MVKGILMIDFAMAETAPIQNQKMSCSIIERNWKLPDCIAFVGGPVGGWAILG